MPLQKQPIDISFAKGLDTKTDPFRIAIGNFARLQNSIFDVAGRLTKRNGYKMLAALPDATSLYTTTFNGNLTAIGNSLQAYSSSTDSWVDKGDIQPLELSTLPLIRSNTNQTQADAVVASNGLVCTVYTDSTPDGMGGTDPVYKYVVADKVTGQNIVAPTIITPPSGEVEGSPRVFALGRYFVIVYTNNITGTYHLQYIAININIPTSVTTAVDISAQYTPSTQVNFDCIVANNTLYTAWNGSDGTVKIKSLSSTLVQSAVVSFGGQQADILTIAADISGSTPVIYVAYYLNSTDDAQILAVSHNLVTLLAPTQFITNEEVLNLTISADHGRAKIFYEIDAEYSYDTIKTNYIKSNTVSQSGTVGTAVVVVRSVGLASKAFIANDNIYILTIYQSNYQPTYFLVDQNGNVVCKLAYGNGGSYYAKGLPGVSLDGDTVSIPYLIKDLVEATNKTQGASSSAAIYSQTGINIATMKIGTSSIVTAEIANDLHLSGGFIWIYDGYTPVEHGFHLWPDYVEVDTDASGGYLTAQKYFYQVTYEWSDNQGNIYRSAPSVPISVTTTGSTSTNTISIPTLRLTYKTANPVKIVIYRWSQAQQTYYQVTSILAPLMNDTTEDSVEFDDTLADSSILGNNILYTTGGVLENIAAPATNILTLWQSRLWYLFAEDPNLVGFSKQVIESTPVETSDLLTIFVPPTAGAQFSTGPLKCASAMDDKLILFKRDAIYYINGSGPDNTGANSQYGDATFITSTVGCENQKSIVFMPQGIMFQSDKGIWLLGRDLSTNYIGAPVEAFTQNATVQSAVNVPGTNQVRFTLDSGVTLMYDYFYGQWGTFVNVPAISACIYQNLHTYINSAGQVYQENPGSYLDGGRPVLMSFTTGWLNMAGLQGFQRAYMFYLLGVYKTPHKINLGISYDYVDSPEQVTTITPDSYNGTYGSDPIYGSSALPYGGNSNIEQYRVDLAKQRCESFKIAFDEIFDPSYGTTAGQGLTLSGLNVIVGIKKGYFPIRVGRQVG